MNHALTIILIFFSLTFVCFTYVILFGAPFLPTLKVRAADALDLLELRPGQTLLELGSGDGRILRLAAQRGIYAIGYELNPLLVLWSKLANLKYRQYITVRWGNYWHGPLPVTDAIYVFLLNPYMEKLHKKIEQDRQSWPGKKHLKVVSFAFEIPGKKPIAQRSGMLLYEY